MNFPSQCRPLIDDGDIIYDIAPAMLMINVIAVGHACQSHAGNPRYRHPICHQTKISIDFATTSTYIFVRAPYVAATVAVAVVVVIGNSN